MKDKLSNLAFFNSTRGKILSGIEWTIIVGGLFSLITFIVLFQSDVRMRISLITCLPVFIFFGFWGFLVGYYNYSSFILIKLFPATPDETIKFKQKIKRKLNLLEQKRKKTEDGCSKDDVARTVLATSPTGGW